MRIMSAAFSAIASARKGKRGSCQHRGIVRGTIESGETYKQRIECEKRRESVRYSSRRLERFQFRRPIAKGRPHRYRFGGAWQQFRQGDICRDQRESAMRIRSDYGRVDSLSANDTSNPSFEILIGLNFESGLGFLFDVLSESWLRGDLAKELSRLGEKKEIEW